jgi:hypothetical protein
MWVASKPHALERFMAPKIEFLPKPGEAKCIQIDTNAQRIGLPDPTHAGEMLEQALTLAGPVIIEAVVDPLTTMLPPKIKPNQAVKFSEALLRCRPERLKIALTAASDTVRQVIYYCGIVDPLVPSYDRQSSRYAMFAHQLLNGPESR